MSKIAYAINIQATLDQSCVVLDLLEIDEEAPNCRLHPIPNGYLVAQWRSLTRQSSVDKEVFALLLNEELSFQEKANGRRPRIESLLLKQVHLSPSQLLTFLKLLSPTQKLYCQGKELIIDLFGQTEFYYEATPLKGGELEMRGRLRWHDKDIALSECEGVGPGKPHHWFIRGLSLKMIHTCVSWKRLQELKRTSLLLEGRTKQIFLDSLDPGDPDLPKLIVKEGSPQEALLPTIPYPLLRLRDRWGVCADLWMDYGNGHLINLHDPFSTGPLLLRRQLEVEANWEKDLLETDFIKKEGGSSPYYCPLDRVAKSLLFLLEVGWNIQDCQHRHVMKQSALHLQLEDRLQTICVKGHLSYEIDKVDVTQVLGALNRHEHFIELSPHVVGLLSFETTQHALQDLALEGEWINGEMHVKKNRLGSLEPLWECAQTSPSLNDLKQKCQHFKGIKEAPPSSAFKGELRRYQQEGVNWLAFLHEHAFHGLLADEMGLGKTVQVLAFLSRLPRGRPHLIVMPTSLLFNWRHEIHQFIPSFTYQIHQGAQRSKTPQDLQTSDLILTSYTTLRLDLPLFQTLSYSCLILDEAQMIKNATTQTAQAVFRLHANLRLSVTGTPVENRLQELWSHFHFLMPDLFGSHKQFEEELQGAQADRRYLERIKRKASPFLLRRRKQDVAADLPSRLDQVIWIEMSEEQRSAYDQLLAGFKGGLLKKMTTEGVGKHRLEVLEAILRLRQVCCHPLLVSSLLDEPLPSSAKFETLLLDLETIVEEGHKVLVYSQFTSMLHLMTQAAKEKGWPYGYLDGSTSNREEVVKRFQEDPSLPLFFISLKAGGVGLNLTAADYVYLYDPWWNEAAEEQAINRAHRIGRKHSVIAKRFVITQSIEEKMMKLKEAKRSMMNDLLDEASLPSHLTIEDLQFLLS